MIDEAGRPERAMRAAQAKASLHELNYEEPEEARAFAAIEARAVARFLGHKLPIDAEEAAACAIDAFHEAGFEVPRTDTAFVLEGARNGVEERERWEEAERDYRERQQSVVCALFAEQVRA